MILHKHPFLLVKRFEMRSQTDSLSTIKITVDRIGLELLGKFLKNFPHKFPKVILLYRSIPSTVYVSKYSIIKQNHCFIGFRWWQAQFFSIFLQEIPDYLCTLLVILVFSLQCLCYGIIQFLLVGQNLQRFVRDYSNFHNSKVH